jgi:outer membrane biosynthesis protein TonB
MEAKMAKKAEPKPKDDVTVSAPKDDVAVAKKKPASKASKSDDKKPSPAETTKQEAVPEMVKEDVKDTEKPSAPKAKAKKEAPAKKADGESEGAVTLESFGPVRKAFILENIRIIDYRDLAKLTGIKPDDLKNAVEAAEYACLSRGRCAGRTSMRVRTVRSWTVRAVRCSSITARFSSD